MSTYTLVNMVNAGIPFLLLPFLTTYLTKEDYGILTNINSLTALIIPLIGINLEGAVSRQFVNKEIDLSLYISSAFRTIFFSSIFFVGFFYGINNWLSDLTNQDTSKCIARCPNICPPAQHHRSPSCPLPHERATKKVWDFPNTQNYCRADSISRVNYKFRI